MLTLTMVRMEDAARLEAAHVPLLHRPCRRVGEQILNRERASALSATACSTRLGDVLVYAPLRNRFGFTRIKVGYTAGEAIGPEIFRFYRSIGVNLKQLYGQTEASVYVTMQPDGEIRADTVGRPAPQVEIRIAENGEVLLPLARRVRRLLQGRRRRPPRRRRRTASCITGDAGFFDADGHLKIIDRAKDVGKLTRRRAVRAEICREQAEVLSQHQGSGRASATGATTSPRFINIDLVAVGNWAERNGVTYASYQELAGHPLVYDMIEKHVDEVNRSLADGAAHGRRADHALPHPAQGTRRR